MPPPIRLLRDRTLSACDRLKCQEFAGFVNKDCVGTIYPKSRGRVGQDPVDGSHSGRPPPYNFPAKFGLRFLRTRKCESLLRRLCHKGIGYSKGHQKSLPVVSYLKGDQVTFRLSLTSTFLSFFRTRGASCSREGWRFNGRGTSHLPRNISVLSAVLKCSSDSILNFGRSVIFSGRLRC